MKKLLIVLLLLFSYTSYSQSARKFVRMGDKKVKKANKASSKDGMQRLTERAAAIEDYTNAIELDSTYIKAYFNRGFQRHNIDDYKGAIEDYTKVIELDPDNIKAYNERANSKEYRDYKNNISRDYKGAIEDYSKVIDLDPDNIKAYSDRGLVKARLSDYEGAIEDFTKVINLKPDEASYNERGVAKRILEDYKGAIEDFTIALKLNPNKTSYYLRDIAWCKTSLEDYKGAIDDYTKLIELEPDEVFYYFSRGYVKELSGDLNGACVDYNKGAKLGDDFSARHLKMPKCQNYSSPDNSIVDKLPQFNKAGTTLAGGNEKGSASNQLSQPTGIDLDADGNLYIADTYNHRIQKWEPGATEGTTVAGGSEEYSRSSTLSFPTGITIDASGRVIDYLSLNFLKQIEDSNLNNEEKNKIKDEGNAEIKKFKDSEFGIMYITDNENDNIKMWKPGATEGLIIIGLSATSQRGGYKANQLLLPYDICIDDFGNLYIADGKNNRIQKWAPGTTEGTTVGGGNGKGSASNQLKLYGGYDDDYDDYFPYVYGQYASIILDASGNLYIADTYNNRIQKWEPGAREGITVAGGNEKGSASNQLSHPVGIALDASENLYIADAGNNRIQIWAPGAREGTTIAGGNGEGSASNQLSYPSGIALDDSGNLYIADRNNHRIQKFTLDVGTYYGKEFSILDVKDYKSNKEKFIADTENPIKIEGEILSSCPMKGCWMKIKSEEDTILVRFKDYGFFVPKDGIVGDKTIINGKLSVDTLSVDLLRHYAEDAGKSSEEINKIIEPEISMTFLAEGVLIRKEQ